MSSPTPSFQLCVLGCGTMGVAILSGILDNIRSQAPISHNPLETPSAPPRNKHANGDSSSSSATAEERNGELSNLPDRFVVTVSREESATKLKRIFPETVKVMWEPGSNAEAAKDSEVVILCCKPYGARAILEEPGMKEALDGKLLVSILAGTTIEMLKEPLFPSTKVVRVMTNTPCKIREGMSVITPPQPVNSPDAHSTRSVLLSLFTPLGRCRFLDEKHFDACTALSGSGPAFSLLVLEAMADGGVMMGLPRGEALELAAQSMQGAARMVLQTGAHPASIKDSVTTPGGCTIAGLLAMEDGGVRSNIARAIEVATKHSGSLAGPSPPGTRK